MKNSLVKDMLDHFVFLMQWKMISRKIGEFQPLLYMIDLGRILLVIILIIFGKNIGLINQEIISLE